jgi:hypothetical protein
VLEIKIECDNDAFADGNLALEVARILREQADKLERRLDTIEAMNASLKTSKWGDIILDDLGNRAGTVIYRKSRVQRYIKYKPLES